MVDVSDDGDISDFHGKTSETNEKTIVLWEFSRKEKVLAEGESRPVFPLARLAIFFLKAERGERIFLLAAYLRLDQYSLIGR